MTEDTTMTDAHAVFTHQVATTDALAVAARILAHGTRAAIGASSIEIVAMAKRLSDLATLADQTYAMLAAADELQEIVDPATRHIARAEVTMKISVVGAALEQLGYGDAQPTTTTAKE